MIQGAFRAKRARRNFYKMLARNIEKVWDDTENAFYYIKKTTGEVMWEKPKLLGSDDVDPSPRSRAAAEAFGVKVPPKHMRTPRVLAKDLTPDEAASMLQGMWRARTARRMLYKLLSKNIEKVWDEENKRFYYVNNKTGVVNWEKPKVLKNDDVDPTPRSRALAEAAGVEVPPPHPKTPRVRAKDLTPDEAASMLQGAFRAKRARRMFYKLLAQNIEKVWDDELKRFYYYNKGTNEVTWEKPHILGTDDIDPTPRSRAAAELAGEKVPPKHKNTPRVFAKDLTSDQAASMIQGMWRARAARRMLFKLLSSNFEKLWDADSKKFYYVNKKTGEVDWGKPRILGADDIDPTPRTRHNAEMCGAKVPPKHMRTPRVRAKDLSEYQASLMIQGAWRQKMARDKMIGICHQVYEKAYDPEAKKFYYFNSFTGDVTWEKPKMLGTKELDLTPRSRQHAIDDGVIPAPKTSSSQGGLTGAVVGKENVDKKSGPHKVEQAVTEPKSPVPSAAVPTEPTKPKTPRFKAVDLSEDEAARHIQGAWRAHRARELLRKLVSGVYSKGFDESSGRFFYYNSKTGESLWEKPAVLGESDLDITPRSKIKAKASGALHESPRFKASDLVPEDAAKHLQSWWRVMRARMKLKELIGGVWSKGYDKRRGSYFYYNEKTGESSWVKPKSLGDMDLGLTPRSEMEALKARKLVAKPKTPRFKAVDLSEDEAARHIQGAWRAHRARELLRKLVSGVYSKGFDESSGRFFYYNSKTGESLWEKPAVLGESDLDITPRSKLRAQKSGALDMEELKKKTPRFKASDLSKEQAALHIQQLWRTKLARRKMLGLIKDAYTKEFDPKTGAAFYVNKKTGESMWRKPAGLGGNEDVELSPRSKATFDKAKKDAAALLDSSTAKPKRMKKMTTEEAVVRLQNWWRALQARKHLQAVMQHVYTKGFDPATNEFYYYNKNTGTSLWNKPSFMGSSTPRLTPRSRTLAKSAGIETPARKKAADMTDHEAAFVIQGAFRSHVAFMELQACAERVWQKGYDPDQDVFFYWNTQTNLSTWQKPFALGSADLELTPRSMIGAQKAGRVAKRTKRWDASIMSQPEAATVLQAWWRGHAGRIHLAPRVCEVIHRCYDTGSKNFFWYNSTTGGSTWYEPKLLQRIPGIGDLPLTPRSMMLELHDRRQAQREAKRAARKSADEMTKDEAAFKIQGMYRSWLSRNAVRAIIRSLYEKLYDAQRGTYYYFNHRTGMSSWYKPVLLGSSDIRRAYVHSGSLDVKSALAAALAAAQTAGYSLGQVELRGLQEPIPSPRRTNL